jgi:hypothetical protein
MLSCVTHVLKPKISARIVNGHVRHLSAVKNLSYIQILAISVFHNYIYVAISFGGRFVCSPIFGQGIIQIIEPFRVDLAKTFTFRDRYAHQKAWRNTRIQGRCAGNWIWSDVPDPFRSRTRFAKIRSLFHCERVKYLRPRIRGRLSIPLSHNIVEIHCLTGTRNSSLKAFTGHVKILKKSPSFVFSPNKQPA